MLAKRASDPFVYLLVLSTAAPWGCGGEDTPDDVPTGYAVRLEVDVLQKPAAGFPFRARARLVDENGSSRPEQEPLEVTLSLESHPSGATLVGAMPVTSGKLAEFPGLFIDKPGSDFVLVANAPGLETGRSMPFEVTAWGAFETSGGVHLAGGRVLNLSRTIGVERSDDRGNTFVPSADGLPSNLDPRAIGSDPNNPQTVYLGGSKSTEIFKSSDGGESWQLSNNGVMESGFGILSIAVDPSNGLRVLVGRDGGGLLVSTDAGASWVDASLGLGLGSPVNEIVIGASGDVTIATGTGVFRSSDLSAAWTEASGISGDVRALAQDPKDQSVLLAAALGMGLFRSSDFGETWAPMAATGLDNMIVTELAVSAASARVFAGTIQDGLFRAEDGASFLPTAQGLSNPCSQVSAIEIDPTDEDRVFASCGLLFRTTVGGD